jgi:hypothetical protein
MALELAPLLDLTVIDKDDILERLFEVKGVGDSPWRRTLSRESDLIFRQESEASQGAQFDLEMANTRKILECLPADRFARIFPPPVKQS